MPNAGKTHQGLRKPKQFFLWLAAALIVIGGAALWHFTRWPIYLVWLLCASAATFIFYGYDKWAAKREGQRIPEITLHTLALLGGWAGGWAGRAAFRHKTQKRVFLIVLILATLLHVGTALWLQFG